jgi:hypothetical protein
VARARTLCCIGQLFQFCTSLDKPIQAPSRIESSGYLTHWSLLVRRATSIYHASLEQLGRTTPRARDRTKRESSRASPIDTTWLLPTKDILSISNLRSLALGAHRPFQQQGDALIVIVDLDEPVHVPLPDINNRQAEHLRTS